MKIIFVGISALLFCAQLTGAQELNSSGSEPSRGREGIVRTFPSEPESGTCTEVLGTCGPGTHLGPNACHLMQNGLRTPICECCTD